MNKRPAPSDNERKDDLSTTDVPWYVEDVAKLAGDILQVVNQDYPDAKKLCRDAETIIVPYIEYFTNATSGDDTSDSNESAEEQDDKPEVNWRAVTIFVEAYEKMVAMKKSRVYRSGTFTPDVMALGDALNDM